MLGLSARSATAHIDDVNRRLGTLERRLDGAVGRTSARVGKTADRAQDSFVSTLSSLADQFRGSPYGDEAMKFGNEAARLGGDALRRLSNEVEHRPLVTLAVALGVGILVGVVSGRR